MRAALFGMLATETSLLLLGIATGVLAARLLLPDGRGALAAAIFWPQVLAGIGLVSLNQAATYRIGARPDRGRTTTATAFWLGVALAAATTSAGYALLPGLLGEERADLVPLARAYLLAFVPFNFIALVLLAEDQGRLEFARYNRTRLLVPSSYLVALIALWLCDAVSVATVAAANCGASILATIHRVSWRDITFLAKPSIEEAQTLLRFAVRFYPVALLTVLAIQVDRLVVLTLWGNTAVGLYVVAFTVASSGVTIVTGAFQRVLFPRLAQTPDHKSQARLLERGIRYASLFLLVLFLPLAAVLPSLVVILFGPAFQDAVLPAVVLLGAYVLVGLKTIVVQGLLGLGEGRSGFVAEGIGLTLFIAVVWPLGGLFGLVGVGLALGCANGVALVYLANRLRRHLGLNADVFWGLTPTTISEVWSYVGKPSRLIGGVTT